MLTAHGSTGRFRSERMDGRQKHVMGVCACGSGMLCFGMHEPGRSTPSPSPHHPKQPPKTTDVGGQGGGCPIVRLYSCFETRDALVLELELMSRSDLFDELSTTGVLREGKTAAIVHQVCCFFFRYGGWGLWGGWVGGWGGDATRVRTCLPQTNTTRSQNKPKQRPTGGARRGLLRAAPHRAPGREALQHHLPHPGAIDAECMPLK